MNTKAMNLTILSNEALELLAESYDLAGDWDAKHLCVMEMGERGFYLDAWLDDLAMAGF